MKLKQHLAKHGRRYAVAVIAAYFVLLCICTPQRALGVDTAYWLRWCQQIFAHGIGQVFETDANYPPLVYYFFYFFVHLLGSAQRIAANIQYAKIIGLVFDFAGAISILALFSKHRRNWLIPFGLLLNIAYLYNSYCWGQMDAVYTTLTVVAFIFALKHKHSWALIFFILALNMKVQAIIFLPLLLIVCLPAWLQLPRRIPIDLLIAAAVQLLILLPFIISGTMGKVYYVITHTVDFFHVLSYNAFNIWYFVAGKDNSGSTDLATFMGITYKSWGLIMFCATSALAMLPVLWGTIKMTKASGPSNDVYSQQLFLSAGLVAVSFFFFNTQMHERYAHPAMVLFFVYGLYSRNYLLYILVSIAYLLNTESSLQFFWELNLSRFKIFDPYVVATLFTAILLVGNYLLYRNFLVQPHNDELNS